MCREKTVYIKVSRWEDASWQDSRIILGDLGNRQDLLDAFYKYFF